MDKFDIFDGGVGSSDDGVLDGAEGGIHRFRDANDWVSADV